MKYVKNFKLFEAGDPEKMSALKQKIRDLATKEGDLKDKRSDVMKKLNGEEDPLKSEITALEVQKSELQRAIVKIDMKIAEKKLMQEANKESK